MTNYFRFLYRNKLINKIDENVIDAKYAFQVNAHICDFIRNKDKTEFKKAFAELEQMIKNMQENLLDKTGEQ